MEGWVIIIIGNIERFKKRVINFKQLRKSRVKKEVNFKFENSMIRIKLETASTELNS